MKEKDTILFVQRRFHTNQYPIVKTLHQKGHDVSFLSLEKSKTERYSVIEPDLMKFSLIFTLLLKIIAPISGFVFKLIGKSSYNIKYGCPRLLWYYRYLTSTDPDLIIVREHFEITIFTMIYAWLLDIEIILYSQTGVYREGDTDKFVFRVYKYLNNENVVHISPVLGDTDESLTTNSYYVPFVCDSDLTYDDKEYFKNNKLNIIMVGKLYQKRKRHLLFLDTVRELSEGYDIHATIIGSFDKSKFDGGSSSEHYTEIRKYIDEYNLNDMVDIKTNLHHEEMMQEYRDHDLYILPSENEPAAVSHLEAMGQALPVICSDSNGTKHYIEPVRNGYIFETNNKQDLVNKAGQILSNEQTVKEFGKQSLIIANKKYSPGAYYKRMSKIVKENFG